MNGTLALKEGVPLGDAMGELVDSETLAFEDKLIEMLLEGLVTNFTLFYGVFTINQWCKKCVFNKRTIKVRVSCFFDGVLGPPPLAWHIEGILVSL